jgi:hypothetical protein
METALFFGAAVVFFVLACFEGINLAIMERKVRSAIGTIVDIRTAVAGTMKVTNSKWAAFSYYIDGKAYVSENRIAVPMTAQVGDQRRIRYLIERPQMLYPRSIKRFLIILAVSMACSLVATALLVNQ